MPSSLRYFLVGSGAFLIASLEFSWQLMRRINDSPLELKSLWTGLLSGVGVAGIFLLPYLFLRRFAVCCTFTFWAIYGIVFYIALLSLCEFFAGQSAIGAAACFYIALYLFIMLSIFVIRVSQQQP